MSPYRRANHADRDVQSIGASGGFRGTRLGFAFESLPGAISQLGFALLGNDRNGVSSDAASNFGPPQAQYAANR
jgi:hypothetical protein